MTTATNLDPLTASYQEMWLRLATVADQLEMNEHALLCYESVLRNNQFNMTALDAAAQLHRSNGHYAKAIDLYQQILNLDNTNGRAWASVAHCYVCVDELHKAYTAYQQALIHIREPHDPFLWYGIGVLYDRYGSADHAREAFEAVLSMAPTATFDRHAEVRFRLAMLNKQRRAYTEALDHLRAIVDSPPAPLTTVDVVCHIARVEELRGNFPAANMAYQRALELDPNSAKTLQQFAWYCHTRAVDTTAHFDTAPPTTTTTTATKPTPTALSTAVVPPIDAVVEAASAMASVGSGDVTMAEMKTEHTTTAEPKNEATAAAAAETTTSAADATLPPPPPTTTTTTTTTTEAAVPTTDAAVPPPPSSADDGITTAAAALVEAAAADKVTGTKTVIDASVQADIAKLHERAEALLKRSIDIDPVDQYSYYLLGRCYMSRQDYRAAYDAYQQAVYRDGRNAAFWCSIGVLYYHIQQPRDALDAFSRAIRVDARVPEVWFNLGTLYESCQQFTDAGDAYHRAVELAPDEPRFAERFANVGKVPTSEENVLEVVEPCAGTIVLEARHGALASPFGAHMNGSGASRAATAADAQHEQELRLLHHQQQQQQQQLMQQQQQDERHGVKRGMTTGVRGGRGGATGRGGKRQTLPPTTVAPVAAVPKAEPTDSVKQQGDEWLLLQAQRMMGAAAAEEAAAADDADMSAKRSRKRLSVD